MYKFLLFCLCTLSADLLAQSPCLNATLVTGTLTEVSAYTEAANEETNCFSGMAGDSAVWFKYVVTSGNMLGIGSSNFPGVLVDTRLSVLRGNCDSLYCVAGDDNSGLGPNALVDIEVTIGEEIYIVFDNLNSNDPFFLFITASFVPTSILAMEESFLSIAGRFRGAFDLNGDYLDDVV